MRAARVALVFVAGLLMAAGALAQSYPVKPVRVVVPFPPGGGADVQARILFRELGEQLRQVFVVDNRPGAGGLVGADAVVNSPPTVTPSSSLPRRSRSTRRFTKAR